MFERKSFWYAQMLGSLIGWAIVIAGFIRPYGKGFRTVWLVMAAIWLSHPLEVPAAALKIGRSKGLRLPEILLKTTTFGFTWWLPLKKGVFTR